MIEKLWTPEEIADQLRVDPATVRRWIRDKKLEGIKVGRQWRVEESKVEAFVEKLKEESSDQ